MKKAWVEDAQLLDDQKDISRNFNSVLLRTADVSDFLAEENIPSCALVAPKGFGKTFILKLKRHSLQERDWKCFPLGKIVDRPKDRPPILPNEIISFFESSENWESIWQIALIVCYLKGYSDDLDSSKSIELLKDLCKGNQTLVGILSNPLNDTPFDVVHECLSAHRADIFDIIHLSRHFTSVFQKMHKRAAIFVDNVDEYLQHYINFIYLRPLASAKKASDSEFYLRHLHMWHNGQIGAWRALRRLQGINPHVKIYISIRKEAYHFATGNDPEFQNLRSFYRELRYKRSDIKQIIENNISVEETSKLVDKNARDNIQKFLGSRNMYISNSGTAKHESIMDYWLRHCSLRPRDAVAIGNELSKLSPSERTPFAVRASINSSAAERAQSLFTEVSPFFDALFPEIFPKVIKSNVLGRKEIIIAAKKYADLVREQFGVSSAAATHPFCALYSIGLVGVVLKDRNNHDELLQHFAPDGSVPFGSIGVLPEAELYIIHPALSDYIAQRNVSFLNKLNRHNVIGDGLEWRQPEERRFVVIADMKGYRNSVMEKVGPAQTFQLFWDDIFKQFASNLDYAFPSGGDNLLLADRSPDRVLRAIRALSRSLYKSNYAMQLRAGSHSGFWKISWDKNGAPQPEIIDIVGVAARLEPRAQPGHVLLSEQFVNDAERMGYKFDPPLKPFTSDYSPNVHWDPVKGVRISKETEKEEWVVLYYLDLHS